MGDFASMGPWIISAEVFARAATAPRGMFLQLPTQPTIKSYLPSDSAGSAEVERPWPVHTERD